MTYLGPVCNYSPNQILGSVLWAVTIVVTPLSAHSGVWDVAWDGNALAQANPGATYSAGTGGDKRDDAEALRLFRLAADKGNALAQANLGAMYSAGRGGVKRDDAEALRLFRLAAEQGDARGQANLGSMYLRGRGG